MVIQNTKKFSYAQIVKENFGLALNSEFSNTKNIFTKMISSEIPVFTNNNELDSNQNQSNINLDETNITKEVISDNTSSQNETNQSEVTSNTPNTQPEKTENFKSISTTVITENNLSENYNTTFNSVKIKNETNFDLTNNILEPNISYSDLKNIIIFHTHTCESYTQTEANKYTHSGNFRTIDLNYSVAKVRKCFN